MILVTGGTGMTGQFIVEELQQRGYPVRVLTRAESAERAQALGVEIVIGDLANLDSVRQATVGVTGIVHSACTFTQADVDIAAMQILLAGWQSGPFVFISSLDVYGFAQAMPITEATPLDENYGDYARGKIVCERLLTEQARQRGRDDYAMLRAPYIWGPHAKARQRLVNQRLQEGLPIELPGATAEEWSNYRDVWVDVRDLAWIVAECLVRPPGGPLNVLSGHFIWHDLYAELIRLTGSQSVIIHKPLSELGEETEPTKHLYAQRWRFSDAKLKEHLAFVPRFDFHETLAAVVATGTS